ncbi:uncharacterized protein [Asterias amurensis]|uniref:uncharacterized protein n=1 Tax=Asterias amurensis TaxID=7602 RepID=UPI003AB82A0B
MADVTKRRCIFISNLPPSISSSALESFLLQELESCYHGDSHLIKVMFPVNPATPGLALVTFQDEQAMVRILRKRLMYEGVPLSSQPFLSYVFTSMSAVVNPDVSHLFPFTSRDFNCHMEKRCGVECHQLDEKERDRWMHHSQTSQSELFMLTGNWFQMQNARKFMQEWVVDEKKRSEFMDQSHHLKDESIPKGASSRKHSKRREKELATGLGSSVEEKGIHRNGAQTEVKRHTEVTDSAGLLERNSPTGNTDFRSGKKDRSKAKKEGLAKVACRFDGEPVQPSIGNHFEQEDLNLDAAPHLTSNFAQDGVHQTSSEDITSHGDPLQRSSSQNSEHIRNQLAELSSTLSSRAVIPGEKISDDSKTQTSPSVENGRQDGENSARVGKPTRPPRSVDTRESDLGSVPSVNYMQYVKTPQTSGSSSSQELNKSNEMKGNSKRSEDVSMAKHQEDGTLLTRREEPDVYEGLMTQSRNEGLVSQRRDEGMPSQRRDEGMPPQRRDEGMPSQRRDEGMPSQRRDDGMPSQRRDEGMPSQRQDKGMLSQKRDDGMPSQRRDEGMPSQRRDEGMPSQRRNEGMPSQRRDEGVPSQRRDEGMPSQRRDEGMPSQRRDKGMPSQRRDEGIQSQREELEIDCPEPLPSSPLVSERHNVDEESEDHKESPSSIPVDPGVFSYILLKQSDSIQQVEERFSVKFSIQTTRDGEDADVESAMLMVRSLGENSDIATAHDKFVDLYTAVFSDLKHRVVTFEDTTIDPESLDQTIESIHDVYSSLLILPDVSNKKVLIYGPSESDVRLAKYWIRDAIKKQKRNIQGETSGDASETNGEDLFSRRVDYGQSVLQERATRPYHKTGVDRRVEYDQSLLQDQTHGPNHETGVNRRVEYGQSVQRRDEGMPSQRRDQGMPSQRRDEGMPSQRRDEGMPSQRRDEGIPSQRRDEGMPSQRRDEGMPSQGRDDGMPSQRRDEGMPSQRQDEGMPSQRRDEGMPSQRQDEGMPSQRRDEGMPSQRRDEGMPSQRRDEGMPSQRQDEGMPSQRRDEGMPSQRRDEGMPSQRRDEGMPSQRRDEGMPSQRRDEGMPSQRRDEGMPSQRRDEEIQSQREELEIDCPEPLPSSPLVSERHNVDEESEDHKESPSSIPVDPGVFSYILLKQSDPIQEIEETYSVKFSIQTTRDGEDADVESAMLMVRSLGENSDIATAHDKFVDLYTAVFSDLKHGVVTFEDTTIDPESLDQAIESIHDVYSSVLILPDVSNKKVLVYGPSESDVRLAKHWIRDAIKKQKRNIQGETSGDASETNGEDLFSRRVDYGQSVLQERATRPHHKTEVNRRIEYGQSVLQERSQPQHQTEVNRRSEYGQSLLQERTPRPRYQTEVDRRMDYDQSLLQERSQPQHQTKVDRRLEYEQQERAPRPNPQSDIDGHDTHHSVIRGSNNLSPIDTESMTRPLGLEDSSGPEEHRFTERRAYIGAVDRAAMNIPPRQVGTHQHQVPEFSAQPLPLNGSDLQRSDWLGSGRYSGSPEETSVRNKTPIVPWTKTPALVVALPSSEAVRSKVNKPAEMVSEPEVLPTTVEAVSMTDTIPVDPGVYGYIQLKKPNILRDIEQNYNIKFSVEGDRDSDIYFIRVEANGAVSEQSIQQGKETFLNFYSEVFSGLVHRAINLADFEGLSEGVLEETIQGAEHSFSDVYFAVVQSKVLIFGQGLHNVETARDFVLSRLRQSDKSLVEARPHTDLEVSMESLGIDEMMSRLNHLRCGSMTPDSQTDVHVASQRQTVAEEVNGRTRVDMIDQTSRHYAVTEESTLKRYLILPQDENKPNDETDHPKQYGINNNMTACSTGPTDISPHSGRKKDRTKTEECVYKLTDSRLLMQLPVSGMGVQVYAADITRMAVDAIVSAANEKLTNIGGVAAAICHRAGADVQAECNMLIARHGLLYPSEVEYTGAGRLPCKFILHAVGPRWLDYAIEQDCRQTLRSTVVNCLRIADQELQVRSLAMPLISSGIFGVPFEICLEEICEALREYNDNRQSIKILQQVHIVDLDDSTILKAQDAMIHRLCSNGSADENNLRTGEKATRRGFSSQIDPVTYSHTTVGDERLSVGSESSRRSRREHEPRRTSTRSSRSSVRHLDSSDEDVPKPSSSLSRPVMARSSSLPYLARTDVKDHRRSCWSSETTDITTTGYRRSFLDTDQRSRSTSRTASKVSSRSSSRDDKIKDLLEAHSKAPPSPEMSRKTQYEINRVLTEPIVTPRNKQRPKAMRSQSLGRTVSGDKCVVCSSQKDLSKRKSCEHFVCGICKSSRLDVGRCRQCSKLKSKKEKMCDFCTCSTDYKLSSCRSCRNPICYKCIQKKLEVCRDCLEQANPLPNGHGEKKQPRLREPIIVGTQPSHLDAKKSYRIKSGTQDLTSSRKKPMLGRSQSGDVSQSYSSSGRRHDYKTSGRTSSAFSHEFVTEDAPHDEMIKNLQESKGQEARPHHRSEKGNIRNEDSTRSAPNSRRHAKGDKELNNIGKSSVLQPNPVTCVICMETATNPKELDKCRHIFCAECIDKAFKFKPVCPICGESYGTLRSGQPIGSMTDAVVSTDLPGHPGCGTIIINYSFPNGFQTEDHPNPGIPYRGTDRQAYLPNSREGADVFKLLRRAFDAGLLFTIDRSVTTGEENVVVWNDVHHKTRRDGGSEMHGYPDPTYLQRVRDELEAKGIR